MADEGMRFGGDYTPRTTSAIVARPNTFEAPALNVVDAPRTVLPDGFTPAAPAADGAVPQVGSSLNTLYGVSNDSYLTDDQRKLARMIQGKFDASMNVRDRELARYSAPRLSSFAEDEALARAIATARGLNYRPPADPFGNPAGGAGRGLGGGGGGSGGGPRFVDPRDPTASRGPPSPPGANPAKWAQIMSGLASLAPLLFGKDAYGNFLNKGAIQWAKDKIDEFFPGNGTNMSDEMLERLLDSQGANGSWDVLPGVSTSYGDFWDAGADTGGGAITPDFYGPGSGWGNDVWPAADPWAAWGASPGEDWSNWWTPDSGGDFLDYFGGV